MSGCRPGNISRLDEASQSGNARSESVAWPGAGRSVRAEPRGDDASAHLLETRAEQQPAAVARAGGLAADGRAVGCYACRGAILGVRARFARVRGRQIADLLRAQAELAPAAAGGLAL